MIGDEEGFMKKGIVLLGMCIALSLNLLGCHPKTEGAAVEKEVILPYQMLVQEYAKISLPMDEDYYELELALYPVGQYLSGKAGLEETLEKVGRSLEEFRKKQDSIETYAVPEELYDVLLQYDILPEEFELFANGRLSNLQGFSDNLYSIHHLLLDCEEFDYQKDIVSFWYNIDQTVLENERGRYFYNCVNNWFCNWEGEPLDYVREQVLDKLKFCHPNDFVWETEFAVTEQKAAIYLQNIENCVSELTSYLAEEEESYLQEQRDLEKLIALEDEYNTLRNQEEKLEQLKLILAQMEKVVENVPNSDKPEIQRRMKRVKRDIDRKTGQGDIYYQMVVEEYAKVLLPMDEDGYAYSRGIADVGKYLSGEASKETAVESVGTAIERLKERTESWEEYEISLEMSDLMKEYGISSEFIEIDISVWPETLHRYLVDLDQIYSYLQQAEEYNDAYRMTALYHGKSASKWEAMRMNDFYTYINYHFVDWEDDMAACLEEHLLSRLKYFLSDGYVWETDRNVIFQKHDDYIAYMETLIETWPELKEQIEEEYRKKKAGKWDQ